MTDAAASFTVGARGSRLSRIQTEGACAFLRDAFPDTTWQMTVLETPGDRDLVTPIEKSAPDFFTRDLDEAVRAGTIDCAIHSAKDLPETIADDLDWFWLPHREDPRDGWVLRAGETPKDAPSFRIGISSERRRAFARRTYPSATLLPIRGAIDARLDQLRAGRFDAVLMACAGLNRLYGATPDGFSVQPIPLSELEPPPAQGYLAVVFRAGDARFQKMRARFVKAVRFVSAGVGDAGLCTLAGVRDLAAADVVLHDDLLGSGLLARAPQARWIHVGKRCGAHAMKQDAITRLICDEARRGRRVVRLKGGDAGLFGRLAEETDALAARRIPFLVRPGVSALVAATTGTGMLLTRRGESRGFTVYTPRSKGTETPLVAFMATKVAAEEAARLIAEGRTPETPCAFVWDAQGPHESIVRTTLARVAEVVAPAGDPPGLFLVGAAARAGWPALGELAGRRVLVTGSEAVQEDLARAVEDRGGRPVAWPLIALKPVADLSARLARLADYAAVVLTSPSAVRIFRAAVEDLRRVPRIFTCGAGTDAELRRFGLTSDLMPDADFSAAGLIAACAARDFTGRRILRLRSAKAGPAVAEALRARGAAVDDVVLYDNVPVEPADPPPPYDAVHFASASAVEVFLARYGEAALAGKDVYVMGRPTRAALPAAVADRARILSCVL